VTSRPILFLHGGPGFNSFSEKALLGPLLSEKGFAAQFWNEPSKLRPEGDAFSETHAFSNWLSSVERALKSYRSANQSLHLIGHSYSALAIVRLLDRYTDIISEVTLISPALNIYDTYKNVAGVGLSLFKESDEKKAQLIENELNSSRRFFDPALVNSMLGAASHPDLFTKYWENEEVMRLAQQASLAPEAQFDVDSFLAVNMDLAQTLGQPERLAFSGKVRVIFGKHDPVIKIEQQRPFLAKTFENFETISFAHSGHHPHLEETQKFMQSVFGME
jgi:proline iminopeptidase